MNKVCIYLRKSRADEELEKTNEGETLAKHKKALLKFAKEKGLEIAEIKEEIVSGDSLFFRPKMLELLKEVEAKTYDGVLVMDIDRLGRGGMKDQGIILDAFKESNTKIITPTKTYDLSNELDEEMTEFKTFFSRRELKVINKRMQGGRIRSVEDGNYIATNAPYGYDIAFINKNRTLIQNPIECEAVKIIFKMYIEGSGAGMIAKHLNSLGYRTRAGREFERSSIIFMLKNSVYIGMVTWKKKEIKKSKDPNKIKDVCTRDKSEWIVVKGKHEPIVDEDTFNKVQEILGGKYHVPYKTTNGAANPLAGIIICGFCGSKMVLRKYGDRKPHIICNKCKNKSSRFDYIEKAIIESLENYLIDLDTKVEKDNNNNNEDLSFYTNQLELFKKEYKTLESQNLQLFDLLEQKVYSAETFIMRSNYIAERLNNIKNEIDKIKEIIETQKKPDDTKIILKNAINIYKESKNISLKNEVLKGVLIKVEYTKLKEQKNDDFNIQLFPRF
ncbi:MAG: recombinase family protein [Bacillota bacterium]|nr:recombinase family protein [Bacillota bacterium]